MHLNIELGPLVGREVKRHVVVVDGPVEAKQYVKQQMDSCKSRPYAMVLVDETPLYIIGALWEDGKRKYFEKTYDKNFLAGAPKQ